MRWTYKKVAELVSQRTEAPLDLVWPIMRELIDVTKELLEKGDDVVYWGLGTFEWYTRKPTRFGNVHTGEVAELPARRMLKYTPSDLLEKRKLMDKYGVVLDDKTKEAQKTDNLTKCPICGATLDDGGACPTHGTEPFEKKPDEK